MTRFRILVDMDDTIEFLLDSWVDWLNKKYDYNVSTDDVLSWDMTKAFPMLEPKEVYAPLFDDKLWETVKPMPDAVEILKKIIDDGHEVFIVTSSNYNTIATKVEKVLFKYFPYLDWSHTIVCSNKQMINGDIMVDDGPHNLIGGRYIKLLMDAPHNRNFDETEYDIKRVHNWYEIYDFIKSIS